MAKYLTNSTDIEIEEVSGTENLKLKLASGNSVEQMIGDLSNLTTADQTNVVNAINEINGSRQEGSNANGKYIKYDSGLMICYSYVQTGTRDYPQEFIESPFVYGTPVEGSTEYMHIIQLSTSPSQITIRSFFTNISNTTWAVDNTLYINYLAIGRWK